MKRPNGSGGVRKLSGRRRKPYQAVITDGYTIDKDGNYKRKQVSIGTYKTKREALAALSEWEMRSGSADSEKITFGAICDIVIPQMTASTRKSMPAILKRYQPIVNMKMKDVKKKELDMIAQQFEGMSSATQVKCKHLASEVFRYALENDIVMKDYSQFMRFESTSKKKEKTALTIEEIEGIKEMEDKFWKVMLYSGMRVSELVNMTKEKIFEEDGILCFHVENAKTQAGNRIIPVHSEIMNDVFDILPVKETPLARVKMFIRMDISGHTSHDLRRTFATYGKKCGMDNFYRKALLGHSQTGITDSVYTQATVDMLKSQIELLKYV